MVQLLVGGALTAGFRLTTKLLGSTPRESVERQAQAARAQTKGGVIDIEAKVLILLQTYPGPSVCFVQAFQMGHLLLYRLASAAAERCRSPQKS